MPFLKMGVTLTIFQSEGTTPTLVNSIQHHQWEEKVSGSHPTSKTRSVDNPTLDTDIVAKSESQPLILSCPCSQKET